MTAEHEQTAVAMDRTDHFGSPRNASAPRGKLRLGIIVSHPIQYFAPLYQRLACRGDIAVKVFLVDPEAWTETGQT
jgi:hypothetical protein